MAAKQAAALGTITVATTTVQTTNVGLRLNALRSGATGASANGLAFTVDGKPITISGLLPALGGGASADRPSRFGIFANGQGSFGNQTATAGREPGFDFQTAGLTLGADYRITDSFVLGVAFGYLRTKSEIVASAADAQINGYSGSVYGNYYILPKLYVDGIATYGWNTYDLSRNVTDANVKATADTDGNQFAYSSSIGYDFNAGPLIVGPFARVNYIKVRIYGYQERGAGTFNTRVDGQKIESLTTDVGGQMSYAISTPWGVLTPLVRAEWEHEFKGDSRVVTATAIATPTLQASTLTNDPTRNYANVGAGVSGTFQGGVSAFFYFEETLGRAAFTNHSFTAGMRFEF